MNTQLKGLLTDLIAISIVCIIVAVPVGLCGTFVMSMGIKWWGYPLMMLSLYCLVCLVSWAWRGR